MTKSSYKVRYVVFILTVIVTIIANEAILSYNFNLQNSDAKTINIAGRQRMLSQRITKHLLLFVDDRMAKSDRYTADSLKVLVDEFVAANRFLISKETQGNDGKKIKTLLESVQPAITSIAKASREIIRLPDSLRSVEAVRTVVDAEPFFLKTMEAIVGQYQKIAENKLATTKRTAFLLSLFSILVLLGEFIFIVLPFFNDIVRKNKALALANRKLSDFAHITSHNLRAPLTNMNSLLRFYKESNDERDKEDLMDKFETTINNMNLTMNVLVEALQVSSEPAKGQETIAFQEIFRKTITSISSQITESDAKIMTDFQDAPTVTYNHVYMESIFLNMLTNAIRYRSGKRSPVIKIKSARREGKTMLTFEDNGLGIDMERNGDKLFGLNKVFHRHPDSKGVGLFMTRTQIESLGGEISAESAVDKGTTFKIIF